MRFLKKVAILAAPVKKLSLQEANDRGMFGPVYHGTNSENRGKIEQEGFKVHVGEARDEGISHGYNISSYAMSRPPPVHHLGYGIYFTTTKAIGKQFNNDSVKGLKQYYLDIPKRATINFGASGTMMKWWLENGYDMPEVKDFSDPKVAKDRIEATKHLTEKLKSQYDAVWFKGWGLRKLLDGDQIVVFDPSKIYEVDSKLAKGLDVGAKVKRKADGMVGVIRGSQTIREEHKQYAAKGATKRLEIKWKKGGTDLNVFDVDVEPMS